MEKHEICSIVHSAIVEASPGAAEFFTRKAEENSPDVFFVDLGINSIDYAEIANIVMDKLNIAHSLEIFTRTNRVNDVIEIFYDLISSRLRA